jgi:hypothetical protein
MGDNAFTGRRVAWKTVTIAIRQDFPEAVIRDRKKLLRDAKGPARNVE